MLVRLRQGNVLYLNVGDLARRTATSPRASIDDKLEVRQIGPHKVRVSGYGFEEVRDGST